MERRNAWKIYTADQLKELDQINSRYKVCLDEGKTERECVRLTVKEIEKKGYRNLKDIKGSLKAGDKVYAVCMGKSIAMFQIGKEPLENGMNILGAHIDSPRIDVKQNPLYENEDLAYLDTHYYGGIKKYQWVTLPLALHGVIVKTDGTVQKVNIGEKEDDPVFVVTDLLIHLAGKQMEKKANAVIEGEKLDLLIGSRPLEKEEGLDEDEKDAVKANVMKILTDYYNMEEEDFLSAELEIVPAGKARDCGLDRSMILAYGQDDRVCAYTSLKAILDIDNPVRTACCLLVDKEEVGSQGNTGMHSANFCNILAEYMEKRGNYSELNLRRALRNSYCLSSDVTAAFDPNFPDVSETKNTAYFCGGLGLTKYTGSRGKSGSNDANPEFIATLRRIWDDNNVAYQTAELGKVDVGGGGTIAYIMANLDMDVIDVGVPVGNMHSCYETSSKVDVYETYLGYKVFLKEIK